MTVTRIDQSTISYDKAKHYFIVFHLIGFSKLEMFKSKIQRMKDIICLASKGKEIKDLRIKRATMNNIALPNKRSEDQCSELTFTGNCKQRI